MLPAAAAAELRSRGHDAVTVVELAISAADDVTVSSRAAEEQRVVVTENVADFARLVQERQRAGLAGAPVVFVRRVDLPRRGALAFHLAQGLDTWATEHPDPPIGLYWL